MKGKKNFTGGLSSLLGEPVVLPTAPPATTPQEPAREITKTSQLGTKPEETRATFIVNEKTLEKIKAVAYWERLQIKDVVEIALAAYLEQYEASKGPVRVVPARKQTKSAT